MGHIENILARLLREQNVKKVELDRCIQFDFLGIDDNYEKTMQRYEHMKGLAARIIEIENAINKWAACTALPILMIEGFKETVNN